MCQPFPSGARLLGDANMDDWQQQAMQERMQELIEALQRAETGNASGDDWKIIYFECGLRRENNEFDRIGN
jgi:hypothetical protein